MADGLDPNLLSEAYKRGLLPPEKRGLYDEAVKRGLLRPPGAPQAAGTPPDATAVPQTPSSAPAAPQGAALGPAAAIPFGPVGYSDLRLNREEDNAGMRPFAAGEFLQNLDPRQGWSSEMSSTVQMPDGTWSVVPGLWLDKGNPVHLDEDQAAQRAAEFEVSGKKFPRFRSEQEAERFSIERERVWQSKKPGERVPPLYGAAGPQQPAIPDIANPRGAMGSAFTEGASALRSAQQSVGARAKQMREEMRLKQGYAPGVDYDTGTGWTDAVAMARSDNPAEKRAYLERNYGRENVFQDRRGGVYVRTPDGKMISPEGSGFVDSFLAGLYADAPMIAGATMGGMAGSAGGPLGALAGAGVGGAAGKAAIEASKLVGGEQRKTVGEEISSLGKAGLAGGVGEGAGRLVTGIPRAAGNLFRNKIADVTPETRAMAANVERAGGVAPLRSVTPGLTSAIQKQDISTGLGADFLAAPNRAAVHSELERILGNTGMSAPERVDSLRQILDPTARVSAREAGEPLVIEMRGQAAGLQSDVERLSGEADRQLSQQLSRLNALSRRSPAGQLGEDVSAGIGQARKDFSAAMQKVYSRVDQMIGGQPVVPTMRIKREATRILDQLPKDAQGNPIFGDPRVLKALQQLRTVGEGATPNPNLSRITLGDAQRLRSTLSELGEFTDLTPGIAKRQFDDLRRSVDVAIGQAAQDPIAQPAINLLRRADQTYGEGVRKFEDATINKIVSQARTGILPDPGKVADTILQPQYTARAATIKNMVGERVWRRVAAADWQNVIAAAADPQTGEVSARRLAQIIQKKDRNGLLDLTYEPQIARDMRLYSSRLDARGGKITAANLTPDNFGRVMRDLEVAQAKQDAFHKENFLSELAKPGPTADDAVSFVLRPGQETRLIEAERAFGSASPQMEAVRKQATKELLNSAIVTTQTGVGTTVAGDAIEKSLRRFTPRQQEILFPGGLADDMRLLAREIRFMFPIRSEQLAGQLIGGSVKNEPLPKRFVPLAYYEGLSWIYSQPRVVRALANGLQPGPTQAATREAVRMIFRSAAIGSLPQEQAPQEPDVMSPAQAAADQFQRYYAPGVPRQRYQMPAARAAAPAGP